MRQDIRNLHNQKSSKITYSGKAPTTNSMSNGESRYCRINGELRLYTKQNGTLSYFVAGDVGRDEVTVRNINVTISLGHTRLHDMDSSSDHNSPSGTENNLVDFDASGYPVDDSGIAVSDVSDAVSKKHTRQHAMNSSDDHTSPGGTTGNVVVFGANGYATQDSGEVPIEMESAEALLSQTISNPPTQAEVQAISNKIDTLIVKLRSANVIAT